MQKKIAKVFVSILIEFIIIQLAYILSKSIWLASSCDYLDISIYTALILTTIITALFYIYIYKNISILEHVLIFAILSLLSYSWLAVEAFHSMDNIIYMCDSGWFGGFNYVAYLFYYSMVRFIFLIIIIIVKTIKKKKTPAKKNKIQ